MDRLKLLQTRKKQLADASKDIREQISSLADKDSFVELSAFSFSKNEFYGEDAEGEGVVTGFATIDGYPFYIVAQNFAILRGGMSLAGCKKVVKCLDMAEKNATPVVYIFSSQGVQIGEGVSVLEGMGELLLRSSQFKGTVMQYLIVDGELYGQASLLAATCDFTFFIKDKSVLCCSSPAVISAELGCGVDKMKVGSYLALQNTQLCSFCVETIDEAKGIISKVSDILSTPLKDEENLNASVKELNAKPCIENILKVFDKGSTIEIGKEYEKEIICLLGRIGGISTASVIFDDGDGVKLCAKKIRKIKDFCEFCSCNCLPVVFFVNTKGIEESVDANDSLVYLEIGELISTLDCFTSAKISVIYKKAIGLGYTLFGAKSMGYDYTFAYANAKVALFDDIQGAEIEYKDFATDRAKLEKRYSDEVSDPINCAKGGYIDNIIEPAFTRQYLIASLQMLMR